MISLIKKVLENKDIKNIVVAKAQIWANPSKVGLKTTFELGGQMYTLRRENNTFVLVEGEEYKYCRRVVITGTFKEVINYLR